MPVSFDKSRNRFIARTSVGGERIYIGRFHTEEEAERAEAVYLKRIESNARRNTLDCYEPKLISTPRTKRKIVHGLVYRLTMRLLKRLGL